MILTQSLTLYVIHLYDLNPITDYVYYLGESHLTWILSIIHLIRLLSKRALSIV